MPYRDESILYEGVKLTYTPLAAGRLVEAPNVEVAFIEYGLLPSCNGHMNRRVNCALFALLRNLSWIGQEASRVA